MKIIEYTINSITNDYIYNITYKFDDSSAITEKIQFPYFETKTGMETAVIEYGASFLSGKKKEEVLVIPKEITDMIGQKNVVDIPAKLMDIQINE